MEFNKTQILFDSIEYQNILFINGKPVKLETKTVQSKVKKLSVNWSPESFFDIEAFHNIDAEAELTAILSEQIAAEVDREILNQLRYNQNNMDEDIFIPTRENKSNYNLSIDRERRIFKIPVGNMPDEEVESYIKRIVNKFK